MYLTTNRENVNEKGLSMDKQVFQTDSRQRWNRFKWTLRVLITIAILLGVVFLAMFALEGSPQMPFRIDYRALFRQANHY